MKPNEVAEHLAALDWSATSSTHQLAVSAAVETLHTMVAFAPEPSNVVALPVRPRTCWTTLCHLDGRRWATSSHFGPGGAWAWIVEAVMEEHGVGEDDVHCVESGEDQPYDCDDLVTVDGLPVYRITHLVK